MNEEFNVGDRVVIDLAQHDRTIKQEPGTLEDIRMGIAFVDLDCGISYVTHVHKLKPEVEF